MAREKGPRRTYLQGKPRQYILALGHFWCMPGVGLAGSEKAGRFFLDAQGFSSLLPSPHAWRLCFSYPESPILDKNQEDPATSDAGPETQGLRLEEVE
jgi:hypothetical protein